MKSDEKVLNKLYVESVNLDKGVMCTIYHHYGAGFKASY